MIDEPPGEGTMNSNAALPSTENPVDATVRPGQSSEHSLREHVRGAIAATAPIKNEVVTPASRLVQDLGYDSLGLIELVMILEHELELSTLDGQAAAAIECVSDVEELVLATLLASRGPAA